MNETVKKEQLRSYAEGILKPETVESIMYVESFADEAGDSEYHPKERYLSVC